MLASESFSVNFLLYDYGTVLLTVYPWNFGRRKGNISSSKEQKRTFSWSRFMFYKTKSQLDWSLMSCYSLLNILQGSLGSIKRRERKPSWLQSLVSVESAILKWQPYPIINTTLQVCPTNWFLICQSWKGLSSLSQTVLYLIENIWTFQNTKNRGWLKCSTQSMIIFTPVTSQAKVRNLQLAGGFAPIFQRWHCSLWLEKERRSYPQTPVSAGLPRLQSSKRETYNDPLYPLSGVRLQAHDAIWFQIPPMM